MMLQEFEMAKPALALIEAGGTKFVLGVARADGTILARHRIPTTVPQETIGAALAWFEEQAAALGVARYAAMGIASFGPIQIDRSAADWGVIGATTKPHWEGTDLCAPFANRLGCPVALETDVNGAALAEARWGAGQGHGSLLYLTIGTGVGGGLVSDGRLLHGISHPEMGHIYLPRHPEDQDFAGHCVFHGACLEGLVAGPAIIARWGGNLSELGAGHPAMDSTAWYLGRAIVSFQAIMQPARIVLGGGVMQTPGLLAKVVEQAKASGGGYFPGDVGELVVLPSLGQDAGLLGALAVGLTML
jgi:fructokinase